MFFLETPRLLLVAMPAAVVTLRLTSNRFVAPVPTAVDGDGRPALPPAHVSFTPEWPGEAIASFPELQRRHAADPAYQEWGGIMIDRERLIAVGQMGVKAPPDQTGTVEIGYGVNQSLRGRGYATELARAFATWLLEQPSVRQVTAECLVDNHASARVLQTAGFRRAGERSDDEGILLLWERVT